MDERTLELLDFPRLLSLLAQETATVRGKEMALELRPAVDPAETEAAQVMTSEAVAFLREGELSLDGVEEIRACLTRATKGGRLASRELWEVATTIGAGERIRGVLRERGGEALRRLSSRLREGGELGAELKRCLVPPGELADGASPLLRSLRLELRDAEASLRRTLEDTARRLYERGLLQEPVVVLRDGRGCLPVKQEHKEAVDGLVHAASNTGATLFVEPREAFRQGDRLRTLYSRTEAEAERILWQLSVLVGAAAGEIEETAAALAELDLSLAKGRLGIVWEGERPVFNRQGHLRIRGGRHPLLGERAVPIDLEVGDRCLALVVTGPNTGGKTAALKLAGIMVLMAQSGLRLPAAEVEVPVFRRVLADIGDAQSLEGDTSTFSSHLRRIMAILEQASPHTLALLDEIGAGTDPEEGAALAQAILETLVEKECRVVVTTHYGRLKAFVHGHSRMENAAVGFDPPTGAPTYRLVQGIPGESEALAIARRLGLSGEVIDRAGELLGPEQVRLGELLRHLEEERAGLARAREEGERAAAQAERSLVAAAEAERKTMERVREAYAEARSLLAEAGREAETALKKLRRATTREEFEVWRDKMRSLQRRVPDVQWDCHLGTPDGKEAGRPAQGERQTFLEKSGSISSEIDLRGERVEDALARLDKYLDDCLLAGVARVRIIHGKGTGALRAAVRDYLKGSDGITSCRSGENGEGGEGVTVADLE